jgi:hypothetical protein
MSIIEDYLTRCRKLKEIEDRFAKTQQPLAVLSNSLWTVKFLQGKVKWPDSLPLIGDIKKIIDEWTEVFEEIEECWNCMRTEARFGLISPEQLRSN